MIYFFKKKKHTRWYDKKMWHGAMIMHEEMTHRIGIMLLENFKIKSKFFVDIKPLFICSWFFFHLSVLHWPYQYLRYQNSKGNWCCYILLFQSCMWHLSFHFLLLYMCHCLCAKTVRFLRTIIKKHIHWDLIFSNYDSPFPLMFLIWHFVI